MFVIDPPSHPAGGVQRTDSHEASLFWSACSSNSGSGGMSKTGELRSDVMDREQAERSMPMPGLKSKVRG
jgi:hypothetical protein